MLWQWNALSSRINIEKYLRSKPLCSSYVHSCFRWHSLLFAVQYSLLFTVVCCTIFTVMYCIPLEKKKKKISNWTLFKIFLFLLCRRSFFLFSFCIFMQHLMKAARQAGKARQSSNTCHTFAVNFIMIYMYCCCCCCCDVVTKSI